MVLQHDIAGVALIFACSVLASSAGLGGGGLNLPGLLLFFGFDYEEAVVLSLCTVLGNLLSQLFLNIGKSHPLSYTRPLIYWEIVLILYPAQVAGSNLAIATVKAFPTTVLLIVAIVLVFLVGVKTFMKGRNQWFHETVMISVSSKAEPLLRLQSNDISNPSEFDGEEEIDTLSKLLNYYMSRSNPNTPTQRHTDTDNPFNELGPHDDAVNLFSDSASDSVNGHHSDKTPRPKLNYVIVSAIFVFWLVLAGIYIIMVTTSQPCTALYFSLIGVVYVPVLVAIIWGTVYLRRKQRHYPKKVLEGDIVFKDNAVFTPVMAFVIGFTCVLLGLGGGELMGPLLLFMDVKPQVVIATLPLLSFLTSSSNIIHYAALGEIDKKWGPILGATGLAGGFVGRSIALFLVDRYKRESIFTMILSLVLMISFGLLVYDTVTHEKDFHFHDIC
jgi:uncharacterized membrane protein YfcA